MSPVGRFLLRLGPFLAAGLGIDALAGPADIEGKIAYSIDGDHVTAT